ncbi:hypothetical protein HDU81_008656, partial [Chytriomyces hyalinus]
MARAAGMEGATGKAPGYIGQFEIKLYPGSIITRLPYYNYSRLIPETIARYSTADSPSTQVYHSPMLHLYYSYKPLSLDWTR